MIERITYPAVMQKLEHLEKSIYHVTFPDLSSANTYGINLHDAKHNAEILLGLLLDGKKSLPSSSTLDEIQAHYPDCTVSLITITREF